jgi:hypothetical protein
MDAELVSFSATAQVLSSSTMPVAPGCDQTHISCAASVPTLKHTLANA